VPARLPLIDEDVAMLRGAIALVLSAALAGCLGSGAERATTAAGAGRVMRGDVWSPDAHTPLRSAAGVWRCDAARRVQLRVSSEGAATLTSGGQPLASVAPGRALVNRICAPRRTRALPPLGAPRARRGAALLRCRAPRAVLVDLRNGDLTVLSGGAARFLAGAAVSRDHLEVATYWSRGCVVR